MSLFSFIKGLITPVTVMEQRQLPGGSVLINGQLAPWPDGKERYVEKAYKYNDAVYSVVKLIVDKATLAPWGVYQIDDNGALTEMKAMEREIGINVTMTQYKNVRKKALSAYNKDNNLSRLMKFPNRRQTMAQHLTALFTYKLIVGDYYETGWNTLASGGLAPGGIISLDYLPAQFTRIVPSADRLPVEAGYQVVIKNTTTDFNLYLPEDVLHDYYFNPSFDITGSHLYGMSPLEALENRVRRNNEAQRASASMLSNGGVNGILNLADDRLKDDDIAVEQINAVKQAYEKMLRAYQGKYNSVPVSGYKTTFTSMGKNAVDMQLIDSEVWDVRNIAAGYGVPSQLLNDPDNKTFSNTLEGEKALTTRCAVPLLQDRCTGINRKLQDNPTYRGTQLWLDYDPTVYPELQQDIGKMVDWMDKAWYLTGNQKLTKLGEPTVNDPLMDKIIIPSGFQLLEDLAAMPPDNLGNDLGTLDNNNIPAL